MRAQRIKLRFHRIGIRVAAAFAAPSALSLALALPAYCGLYEGVHLAEVSGPLALMLALIGGVGLGLALACYAGAVALAAIITAFARPAGGEAGDPLTNWAPSD